MIDNVPGIWDLNGLARRHWLDPNNGYSWSTTTTNLDPCRRACPNCECAACLSCKCKSCEIARLKARVAELEKKESK